MFYCHVVQYCCSGRPCVCPVSLLGCSFRGRVLMGGCCRILFARVSLVVFMIGGGRFVRSWVILKPGYGAVETSTQAAAPGPCGGGCSHHCRGECNEADEGVNVLFHKDGVNGERHDKQVLCPLLVEQNITIIDWIIWTLLAHKRVLNHLFSVKTCQLEIPLFFVFSIYFFHLVFSFFVFLYIYPKAAMIQFAWLSWTCSNSHCYCYWPV